MLPERWPGEHEQLERIVAKKQEHDRIMASGTPEERQKLNNDIIAAGVDFIMGGRT